MYCCVAAGSTACVHLTEHHFLLAFEKFTPSTLHNVPVLKPGELTWSDVGGLHDIRAVLEQTLLWPTKVRHQIALFSYHVYICKLVNITCIMCTKFVLGQSLRCNICHMGWRKLPIHFNPFGVVRPTDKHWESLL